MNHHHSFASHRDAASRAAHSHAQPLAGEHGAHGAPSRRTLDAEATPHASGQGSGVFVPASLPRGERERVREGNPSWQGPERAALDSHASSVSAPRPSRINWRRLRYDLRRTAGKVIGGRQARCGAKPLLGTVDLVRTGERHGFRGLETCAGIWTCPVCAMRIGAGRCIEVQGAIAAHLAQGGMVAMATLTIPHHEFQAPRDLLDAVRGAWRNVKQGRAWQKAKIEAGWVGDIRALETTHGGHGWHPHLHVLIFLAPGTTWETAEAFGAWLFRRWAARVDAAGFGACSPQAFTLLPVTDPRKAGEYLGLWGGAQELALACGKRGRGGRTPWEILDDIRRKRRKRDTALFRAYAKAFKGARQLTWSHGLRLRTLGAAEPTDADLAADQTAEDAARQRVAMLTKGLWRRIDALALQAPLLDAADVAGLEGIMARLMTSGIRCLMTDKGGGPILDLMSSE